VGARCGNGWRIHRSSKNPRDLRVGRFRWLYRLGVRLEPVAALVSADELNPIIHVPARLRILVTLATLHDGDSLSFGRLQELIELTPGNLITHLRKLEDAGYITTNKKNEEVPGRTWIALTNGGRAALESYTEILRDLLDSASPN
jgi:DNA-binding MarR family transcriptional regulator